MLMRQLRKSGAFCLAAILGIAFAEEQVCENGVCNESGDKCGLYLAPSTIPNAGLGIFTTKPLEVGDSVGNGDIAIPIVDLEWHRGNQHKFDIFGEYHWQGWAVGMQFESEDEDKAAVSGFIPGMDAAINCNIALVNADKGMPQYDLAGLHRNRDPGAGAMSPYHNGSTLVIADVPAGGELFKYYGNDWFEGRFHTFGTIPLIEDYWKADELLQEFGDLDASEKAKMEVWSIVKSIYWRSQTSSVLPETFEEAVKANKEGVRSLHQADATRPVEWMEEVGRCMDNIRPGPSTVKGAGRGAFATRPLPEGTILSGSPLLHIPFREDFIPMHGYYHDDDNNLQRDTDVIVGQQLVLNYCYGHEESTLLLCPYGAGVNYINHNASLANVKIQWAPHGIASQNDDWFNLPVHKLEHDYKVSLAFDFIATKDIMPGEELFLDYGIEWEEAWERHVAEWEAPTESDGYAPAAIWHEKFREEPARTKLEQEMDPYPSNLNIRCHSEVGNEDAIWPEEWVAEDSGVDCEVLYRSELDGEFVYEIELPNEIVDGKPKRLAEIPRGAIKLVDKPYTTDMHLMSAFRHPLMIPDDMFPEKWKNLS